MPCESRKGNIELYSPEDPFDDDPLELEDLPLLMLIPLPFPFPFPFPNPVFWQEEEVYRREKSARINRRAIHGWEPNTSQSE